MEQYNVLHLSEGRYVPKLVPKQVHLLHLLHVPLEMEGPHAKAGEKQERRRAISPSTFVVDLPAVPPMPCAALLRIVGIGASDLPLVVLTVDIPCCMEAVPVASQLFPLAFCGMRHRYFFSRHAPLEGVST